MWLFELFRLACLCTEALMAAADIDLAAGSDRAYKSAAQVLPRTLPAGGPLMDEQALPHTHRRPFVGVLLKCCNIYVRAHLTPQSEAYAGHCPRCAAPVRIPLSPGHSGRQLAKAS